MAGRPRRRARLAAAAVRAANPHVASAAWPVNPAEDMVIGSMSDGDITQDGHAALHCPPTAKGAGVAIAEGQIVYPGRKRTGKAMKRKRGDRPSRQWADVAASATHLLSKHKVKIGRMLGCGQYACAYEIQGEPDHVIKLTGDPADAAAWQRVLAKVGKGKWPPGLARVRCVEALPPYEGKEMFFIIQDRLFPLNDRDLEDWLDDDEVQDQLYYLDRDAVIARTRQLFGSRRSTAWAALDPIYRTMEWVHDNEIIWGDIHSGNVMLDAKGDLRIVDLGLSRMPKTTVPVLAAPTGRGARGAPAGSTKRTAKKGAPTKRGGTGKARTRASRKGATRGKARGHAKASTDDGTGAGVSGVVCPPSDGYATITEYGEFETPEGEVYERALQGGWSWNRAARITRPILERYGLQLGKQLGRCGTYACAYQTKPDGGGRRGHRVIVKLSGDGSEAAAWQRVLARVAEGHPWPSGLARTYCAEVVQVDTEAPIYVIVQDELRSPSAAASRLVDDGVHYEIHNAIITGDPARLREAISIDHYAPAEAKLSAEELYRLLVPLCDAVRFLGECGAEWHDLHPGNVMQNALGALKIIDVGNSTTVGSTRVPAVKHPTARVCGQGHARAAAADGSAPLGASLLVQNLDDRGAAWCTALVLHSTLERAKEWGYLDAIDGYRVELPRGFSTPESLIQSAIDAVRESALNPGDAVLRRAGLVRDAIDFFRGGDDDAAGLWMVVEQARANADDGISTGADAQRISGLFDLTAAAYNACEGCRGVGHNRGQNEFSYAVLLCKDILDAASKDSFAAVTAATRARGIELRQLVQHQIDPIAITQADIASARPSIQVVWDAYFGENDYPHRNGTLGNALERAYSLKLNFEVPLERAVAERWPEDPRESSRLRKLLAGGRQHSAARTRRGDRRRSPRPQESNRQSSESVVDSYSDELLRTRPWDVIGKLVKEDHPGAVWIAVAVAEDALNLAESYGVFQRLERGLPEAVQSARGLIAAARAWVQDTTPDPYSRRQNAVSSALSAVTTHSEDAEEIAGQGYNDGEEGVWADAVVAMGALDAVVATGQSVVPPRRGINMPDRVVSAVFGARAVADPSIVGDHEAYIRAQDARAAEIGAGIQAEFDRAKAVSPTGVQVASAKPSVQVVWDRFFGDTGPKQISISEGMQRAYRLRLDWHQPLERAIIQRCTDAMEPEVKQLLEEGRRHSPARVAHGGGAKSKAKTTRKPKVKGPTIPKHVKTRPWDALAAIARKDLALGRWIGAAVVEDALNLAETYGAFQAAPVQADLVRNVIGLSRDWVRDPTEANSESLVLASQSLVEVRDDLNRQLSRLRIESPRAGAQGRIRWNVLNAATGLEVSGGTRPALLGRVATAATEVVSPREIELGPTFYFGARQQRAPEVGAVIELELLRFHPVEPTPEQVLAAKPSVQVVWDRYFSDSEPAMVGITEGLQRAQRLGLDWNEPVERAIIQRCSPEMEPGVRALLEGGRVHSPSRNSHARSEAKSRWESPWDRVGELARSDAPGAVWCAAACAQNALEYVQSQHVFPRSEPDLEGVDAEMHHAISAAKAWALDPSADRQRQAVERGQLLFDYDATIVRLLGDYGDAKLESLKEALTSAMRAALATRIARDATDAVSFAATTISPNVWGESSRRSSLQERRLIIGEIVDDLMSPARVTSEVVVAAPPAIQIAWDRHFGDPTPHRNGTLGASLARAHRLGLDFDAPLERAIAERTSDDQVEEVAATLQAARRGGRKHSAARSQRSQGRGRGRGASHSRAAKSNQIWPSTMVATVAEQDLPGAVWLGLVAARDAIDMAAQYVAISDHTNRNVDAVIQAVRRWIEDPTESHAAVVGARADALEEDVEGARAIVNETNAADPPHYQATVLRSALSSLRDVARAVNPTGRWGRRRDQASTLRTAVAESINAIDPRHFPNPRASRQFGEREALLTATLALQANPAHVTAEQLRASPENVQVAFDYLDVHEPKRFGTLGQALQRAHRMGLDWDDLGSRALAERTPDERVAEVVAILQPKRGGHAKAKRRDNTSRRQWSY